MRVVLAVLSLLLPCAAASARHNVLLVIADDVGVDLVGAYGAHPEPALTPVLDGLAADGLLFRSVWVDSGCSPTRSLILTGKQTFRTGLGIPINYLVDDVELSSDELTLPRLLAPHYQSVAVGKWHLGAQGLSGPLHPLQCGFLHHRGSIHNLPDFIGDGYYDYEKSVDGVLTQSLVYATTDSVNDALELIPTLAEPWFLWLAFNAPHAPFHKPPASLHTYDLPASVAGNIPIHVRATLQALDTELGRLLGSLPQAVLDDTIVIFIGDNGTDKNATTPPFDPAHAKATVYEGGVNVPLIIKGPGVVSGAECGALVCGTDLYATVAEIAGVAQSSGVDSVSLVPYFTQPALPSLRPWNYIEQYTPNGQATPHVTWERAARNDRYKLIALWDAASPPEDRSLYDLLVDPFETNDLLDAPLDPDQQAALAELDAVLDSQYGTFFVQGHSLAGSAGIAHIDGAGSLQPQSPFTFSLAGFPPGSVSALLMGLSQINLPLKGGLCVPAPDVVVSPLIADPTGSITLAGTWPIGIPPGFPLWYQAWFPDSGGPAGYAASNALLSVTP